MKNTIETSKIQEIINKHTKTLNVLKENLSHWEEERWTDAEIRDCEHTIIALASILSDLNRCLAE